MVHPLRQYVISISGFVSFSLSFARQGTSSRCLFEGREGRSTQSTTSSPPPLASLPPLGEEKR